MLRKKVAFLLVGCFHFAISSSLGQSFEARIFNAGDGGNLPYRILFPESYDRDQSYPLVLFLHGAGERGADNEAQLTHGANLFLDEKQREKFPAIVVFPQCPKNGFWSSLERDGQNWSFPFSADPNKDLAYVMELVDKIELEEAVDPKRIYVMGLSMGGFGTLELIARQPERFAAAIPICGGGNLALTKAYGPQVPVWLFHGALDDVVPPQLSRDLYDKLRAEGAEVRYTEYPEANHNSWDSTFAEPMLLPWLFQQRKMDAMSLKTSAVRSSTSTYAKKQKELLQLDLFQPEDPGILNGATIIYVHGGGFAGGQRDEPRHIDFAQNLARRGYTVANISYLLTMKGKSFSCDQPAKNKLKTFLAAVNDIRSATQYLLDQTADLGIDPTKIVLAGSSAGAEAILHAAFWDKSNAPGKLESLPKGFQYAGLISMAGAIVDISLIQEENAIPSMFYHGTCDNLVPYAASPHHYCAKGAVGYLPLYGSYSIAQRLAELETSSYLFTACGGGHEWAGLPLAKAYIPEMDQFIQQTVLKGQYMQVHMTHSQSGSCNDKPQPGNLCR